MLKTLETCPLKIFQWNYNCQDRTAIKKTVRKRQLGYDCQDRKPGWDRLEKKPDTIARKEHQRKGSQEKTSRMGIPGKESRNKKIRRGKPGQDGQDWTAKTGRAVSKETLQDFLLGANFKEMSQTVF
jgi:hypothetical protein